MAGALVVLTACASSPPPKLDVNAGQTDRPKLQTVSLLGRQLLADPPSSQRDRLQAELAAAQRELAADPQNPDKIVWVGRRLGYLWRIREAIEVYTRGIERHPDYAPLYRHRGHRYISLRRFPEAIADLERAAKLIDGKPDRVELDGMPNDRGIPLTTTGFNIWYHLGLARYLTGDFEGALVGFRRAALHGRGFDDSVVSTADWMYMALRRLGREREAAALLQSIHPDMDIIENHAYHRRLLMYKGLIDPKSLLDVSGASDLDLATMGYGLGNWLIENGKREEGAAILRRVVSGPYWPAFGFIAAEVELASRHAGE